MSLQANMMRRTSRGSNAFAGLALCWLAFASNASAHEINCDGRTGIDQARCLRHQRMFAACGPLQGDAHFACDRDYLLANPLPCSTLTGSDQKQCQTELAASKACEPQTGRAFMRCVRDSLAADDTATAPAKAGK